jgi:hypothetical protein
MKLKNLGIIQACLLAIIIVSSVAKADDMDDWKKKKRFIRNVHKQK